MTAPSDPCARIGWIARNGDFFACCEYCHKYIAEDIVKLCLGAFTGEVSYAGEQYALEQAGWAKIYGDGSCFVSEYDKGWTLEMIDTLGKLVMVWNEVPQDKIITKVMSNPEDYELPYGWSRPDVSNFMVELRNSYKHAQGLYGDNEVVPCELESPEGYFISTRIGYSTGD